MEEFWNRIIIQYLSTVDSSLTQGAYRNHKNKLATCFSNVNLDYRVLSLLCRLCDFYDLRIQLLYQTS